MNDWDRLTIVQEHCDDMLRFALKKQMVREAFREGNGPRSLGVETKHRSHHQHLIDLYREAEAHRLVQRTRANERRTRLDLAGSTAWVAGKLAAAGTRLQQRFISPCGQFTLWQAEPDC